MVSVSGKFCIFSHKNKQHQRFFQLLPDGKIKDIGGTDHDNERFWHMQENKLQLFSSLKDLTAVFDCFYEEAGYSYWEGLHQGTIPL